jgi:hypothetical protein
VLVAGLAFLAAAGAIYYVVSGSGSGAKK